MPTVLDDFIMRDPYYKETREAAENWPSGVDKSPAGIFATVDAGASAAAEKLRPLLEERYPRVTYDEVSKNEQQPGGMGGLNNMYQGLGSQWYNYYRRIETEMKKLSEARGGKSKTAGGRRRKTKKSKRRHRKTRRSRK